MQDLGRFGILAVDCDKSSFLSSVLERAIHRGRAFIRLSFAINRVLQLPGSLYHTSDAPALANKWAELRFFLTRWGGLDLIAGHAG